MEYGSLRTDDLQTLQNGAERDPGLSRKLEGDPWNPTDYYFQTDS